MCTWNADTLVVFHVPGVDLYTGSIDFIKSLDKFTVQPSVALFVMTFSVRIA